MVHLIHRQGSAMKTIDATAYLLEWPKSGTPTTANADEDAEQQELSVIAGGHALAQPLRKPAWWFLTNLNILLLYDPAMGLHSIYPKELQLYVHTNKPLLMDV